MQSGLLGVKFLRILQPEDSKIFQEDRLVSLVNNYVWKVPDINDAFCRLTLKNTSYNPLTDEHGNPPHIVHDCGFNAFYRYEDAFEYRKQWGNYYKVRTPIVMIETFGKVIMKERGFRAAKARIAGFLWNELPDIITVPGIKEVSIYSIEEMQRILAANQAYYLSGT